MSSPIRQQRVAELLFEELNIMVSGELADPRISLVTVTHVDVSKDLRNARVYVNHQDDSVRKRDLLKALEHATPWMRGQLATRLTLQFVPDLFFQYDDSPERAARVDEILRQISAERPSPRRLHPIKPRRTTLRNALEAAGCRFVLQPAAFRFTGIRAYYAPQYAGRRTAGVLKIVLQLAPECITQCRKA